MLKRTFAALLFLGVSSCSAHTGTVRARFASDFGCHGDIDVDRSAGTSYVARGCGITASYTCARDRNMYDTFNQACVREGSYERPTRISNRARRASQTQPTVERGYDDARKLHTVRGTFKVATHVTLVLAGAPGAKLGEVLVELSLPYHLSRGKCEALEVLINKAPTAGENPSVVAKNAIHTVQGRLQFETFKPLAQAHSTLGARACGYEAELDEPMMADVKKFFVIYSQLATEAMQQSAPAPAADAQPADGTTKEL